jgi:hypothetical protein
VAPPVASTGAVPRWRAGGRSQGSDRAPGQGQAPARETTANRNPARPKRKHAAEKVGKARMLQSEERREAAAERGAARGGSRARSGES